MSLDHTRQVFQMTMTYCRLNILVLLSVIYFIAQLSSVSGTRSGSLLLRKRRGGGEYQVRSKNCSGVFFKASAEIDYECACITGVWAFYEEFCGEPALFVGGYDYCFSMTGFTKLAQAALIGSYRDVFEPSISHFQKPNFTQMTTTITDSEYHEYNRLEVDALGSWITVTNVKWTLFGDAGESICLEPTVDGERVICTYNQLLQATVESMNWNYIIHVQKGCHTNTTVKADACYPLHGPTDKASCQQPPITAKCVGSESENGTASQDSSCEAAPEPTTTVPTTTTPKPLCGDITRELVKRYWLDPANNECAKSLNEAILTDQLRRFATTRFDKLFESRLQSLDQMTQIVTHSRDIIKKTCSNDYVPAEFFDVATDAFLMFIKEDFFYGVEGVDQISFERVMNSLKKCWKRAKLFVYETKPLGCDLKQVTGTLILPNQKIEVNVPENMKSKHFEPLIESAWKMFLNAHSYCYEDFQIPNDHHHFSVLYLELFSKAIYEKWIDPLPSRELYKFIVPKFGVIKEIMENMDYCVAAAGQVSLCPVWMTRSNPEAKSIVDSITITNPPDASGIPSDTGSTSGRRKKRSTWVRGIYSERMNIWDGDAYCVHNMVDPSRLGLATCTEAF